MAAPTLAEAIGSEQPVNDSSVRIGVAVMQATGDSQQPWVSSSPIRGNFYFAGHSAGPAPSAAIAPSPGADEVFWQAIKDDNSQTLFDEFLKKYPSSTRTIDARARLEELRKKQVAMVAPPIPTPSADPCAGAAVTVSQSPLRVDVAWSLT